MATGTPVIDELWNKMISRRANGNDFRDFLRLVHFRLDSSLLACRIGGHEEKLRELALESTASARSAKLVLDLRSIEDLTKTRRIDGVLPFTIPLAADILDYARTFSAALQDTGCYLPNDEEAALSALKEFGMHLLASLHGSRIQLEYGMTMPLHLTATDSNKSVEESRLRLMGGLPLGGKLVVFHSSLSSPNTLESGLAHPEAAHELDTIRNKATGKLVIGKRRNSFKQD